MLPALEAVLEDGVDDDAMPVCETVAAEIIVVDGRTVELVLIKLHVKD